jgi:hypothetical protein
MDPSVWRTIMASTRFKQIAFALISVASMTAGCAGAALADTKWQADHPRREQVNQRLANQSRRIGHDVRDGSMTHRQAHQLRTDDRQIRQEERDMARQDDSHITRQEQRTLNHQENAVSRQIRADSH